MASSTIRLGSGAKEGSKGGANVHRGRQSQGKSKGCSTCR